MTQREILVTHALPYANGPLHIGHLLGYIQTDIWVAHAAWPAIRVQFHGPRMTCTARRSCSLPRKPDSARRIHQGHADQPRGRLPRFRRRSRLLLHDALAGESRACRVCLHAPAPKPARLRGAMSASFMTRSRRCSPDRYIKGECPVCGTPDQYGDNCENCGSTYAPTDLKNPRSVVSGAKPEMRDSEHYFFEVGKFASFLREWLAGRCCAFIGLSAMLKEWLESGRRRARLGISRAMRRISVLRYRIRRRTKFFLRLARCADRVSRQLQEILRERTGARERIVARIFPQFHERSTTRISNPKPKCIIFIGKDIVNSHGLFWPAMLEGVRYRVPTALHVNGYLTVNGEKMSKSRGTFIQARTYLDAGLNPDYLRYYFATMLSAGQPLVSILDLKRICGSSSILIWLVNG